jgi:hypothetical protein
MRLYTTDMPNLNFPKSDAVLQSLEKFHMKYGYYPSVKELLSEYPSLGIGRTMLYLTIRNLEKKDMIKRNKHGRIIDIVS